MKNVGTNFRLWNSKKLVEALKENTTLICVDIEENSEMGLREIREI